jgi:hypothetical protein
VYRGAHRRPASLAPRTRRKRVWADYRTITVTSTAAGVVGVDDLLTSYRTAGGSTQGVTIAAIYLNVSVAGMVAGADFMAYGIYVDDRARLSTEVSQPEADPNEDWMINTVVRTHFTGATADSMVNASWVIRSKRRCDEIGQTLWLVHVPSVAAGNAGHIVQCRTLLLLP